ncbi:MAG: UvrD-helicase domain-containing protein, partial [Alphaproteobacteria bacterium]|nr:UvrD-helicase domain-containing protein [Alphaproteobacteria bacterium]
VDEFQDTNAAQMALLKMLTKDNDNPNICCVGDDDQSIYSWRGAEIKNILEFEKTYKNAKIIRLEINYRSTGNILGAANSLIRHNHERLGKELKVADNVGIGEPVYVLTTPTDWDEAKLVADTIIKNGKNNLSDFVILIRAGSVSRTFEEEFNSRNIPYRIIGATKFYDRMEIRDAIAYTRLLVYPFDDISFERVISKPSRKIGPAAMIKMRELGGSLMDGLRNVKLSVAQRKNADEFLNAFDFDWQNIEPKIAVQKLLEDSGYLNMWRQSKDNDAEERIEHIKELLSIVEKYDSLYDFLEHAALMMTDDNDNEYDDNGVVNIMTIHAAKGLEFDSVFLPAWEEGVFPNDNKYDQDIEEERRLAYVAITRAKKRVIITNAMSRMMFGERKYNSASRFIGEIDKKFIKSYGDYDSMVESSKPVIKKTKTISADVGKMVEHKTLGRGVVIASDEDTLTIAFKTKGVKKVMREFIEFV